MVFCDIADVDYSHVSSLHSERPEQQVATFLVSKNLHYQNKGENYKEQCWNTQKSTLLEKTGKNNAHMDEDEGWMGWNHITDLQELTNK